MDKVRYDEAVNRACNAKPKDQHCKFIKSVASTIVGLETLKNCSVKGRKCNRFADAVAKPAIDPDKLSAIYGIFEHFLTTVKKENPVEIELAQAKVGAYIASKIADLNRTRKPKSQKQSNQKDDKITNSKTAQKNNDKEVVESSDDADVEKESKSSGSEDDEAESSGTEVDEAESSGTEDEYERTGTEESEKESGEEQDKDDGKEEED